MTEHHWLSTPAETATAYVRWAEQLQNTPGITYGCCLDKAMIPLHPGDLMAVVARPGHGKSSWMAALAKRTALDIVKRGAADDEVVIYVTWESSKEEMEAFFQSGYGYTSTDLAWGRVDLDKVKWGACRRPSLPVWLMGNSVSDPDPHRQPMYVDTVFQEIRNLAEDFGRRPVLICLDYLQIIPVAGAAERNKQVHEATIEAKQLALAAGVPIVAGVQARRDVDTRRNPIPAMADAQWASSIEQTADKQISVFRPIKHWPPDDDSARKEVTIGNRVYPITPELFVIQLLKQRFDIGYGKFAVHFVPQTLELRDYAFESISLEV